MSGCHVPLTMGNVAYSPSYGGYCGCPCHNGLIPWNSYQCFCSCNKYRPFVGVQPTVIYLENKVMEERIKNIETRLKELEEWTRKDEDKVHEKLKDLEESYQGLSAELRFLLERPKKPYACPVCLGLAKHKIFGQDREAGCNACEEKGIVWG